MHKMSEVKFDESLLLKKGYNAKDLIGETFVVNDVTVVTGDNGDYITCDIFGDKLEPGKPLNTGAQNISVKLLAAKREGLLPLEVTVVKLGGNALDIE